MSTFASGNETYAKLKRTPYSINTISLFEGSVQELSNILKSEIDGNALYQNSAFILDLGTLPNLQSFDYESLKELCTAHNVYLLGVSGVIDNKRIDYLKDCNVPIINSNKYIKIQKESEKPKVITQTFEVKVPVKVSVPYEVKVPYEVHVNSPLKAFHRNIRSGEVISSADNSIVIFGKVSAGAKIIAGHNIIIIGDLKGGQVYAGNPKDEKDTGYTDAFIYVSGKFNPGFVAIAGIYQTAEDMESDPLIGPASSDAQSIAVSLDRQTLRYWNAKEFQFTK